MRRLHKTARLAAAILVTLAACGPAQAVGRWNLPSAACQWLGYGYGPGYHAPMLLGPAHKAPVARHGVRRLPQPPAQGWLTPSPHDALPRGPIAPPTW